MIWTSSPGKKLFRIELHFQNTLNHSIHMLESKVIAETLRQRQNCHVHANSRCTWDNLKEITELIGKEQKFKPHMV